MPRIHLVTDVAADIETVFDLSVDVDVHMASSAPSNERAVRGVTHGPMTLGDTVTWQAVHFGIPWRVTSRITAYDRPHGFTDEMRPWPFRRWRHVHRFEAMPDGGPGTRMTDDVDYAAPLPLPFLHGYMTRLLQARNDHIRRVAEGGHR